MEAHYEESDVVFISQFAEPTNCALTLENIRYNNMVTGFSSTYSKCNGDMSSQKYFLMAGTRNSYDAFVKAAVEYLKKQNSPSDVNFCIAMNMVNAAIHAKCVPKLLEEGILENFLATSPDFIVPILYARCYTNQPFLDGFKELPRPRLSCMAHFYASINFLLAGSYNDSIAHLKKCLVLSYACQEIRRQAVQYFSIASFLGGVSRSLFWMNLEEKWMPTETAAYIWEPDTGVNLDKKPFRLFKERIEAERNRRMIINLAETSTQIPLSIIKGYVKGSNVNAILNDLAERKLVAFRLDGEIVQFLPISAVEHEAAVAREMENIQNFKL